jgi:hypothetical protein
MNLFFKNTFQSVDKRVPKGSRYIGFLILKVIFAKLANYIIA